MPKQDNRIKPDRIRTVKGRKRLPIPCERMVSKPDRASWIIRTDVRRSHTMASWIAKPQPRLLTRERQALGGGDCDVCHIRQFTPESTTSIAELRQSSLHGRQCCGTILDAIETSSRFEELGPKPDFKMPPDETTVRIVDPGPRYRKEDSSRYVANHRVNLSWIDDDDQVFYRYLTICEPKDISIPDDDFASRYVFPHRRLPSGDTGSPEAFNVLQKWINTCTRHHQRCFQLSTQDYAPKRVLEIAEGKVFLREHLTIGIRYICLSHCWGPRGVAFKLTGRTRHDLTQGIEVTALPRTFREAVEICLRLGVSYLWIDALCIVQDDPQDWTEAAATMADIYANGFLTIAATASGDSNGGCFSDPNSPYRLKKLKNSILHVARHHSYDLQLEGIVSWLRTDVGDWPLLKRAWIFQERRMSVRMVHFTDVELLWECHSMYTSESGDINHDWTRSSYRRSEKLSNVPLKYPLEDPRDMWQQIVQDYSSLRITFTSDRLPALAAVAQRLIAVRPDDQYIAGMWTSSLARDLTWHKKSSRVPRTRTLTSVPTWSWASADEVTFLEHMVIHRFKVLSTTFTPVGPQHLGAVVDASIHVQGPSCPVTLSVARSQNGTAWDYHVSPAGPISQLDSNMIEWEVTPDLILRDDELEPGQDVKLVIVLVGHKWRSVRHRDWRGLVLRKTACDTYERVGLCGMRARVDKRRRAGVADNFEWRVLRQHVEALPIRQFSII